MSAAARRLRVPLRIRLVVPVIVLALAVGPAVTWFLVRDVARRSKAAVDQQLLLHAVNVRSRVHERELYLLEAAHYAANLSGMADAADRRDPVAVRELLRSVLALKSDLSALAVVGMDGAVVAGIAGGTPTSAIAIWPGATDATIDDPAAAFVRLSSGSALAISVPVCSEATPCVPIAFAVTALSLDALAADAGEGLPSPGGVTIFGRGGEALAAHGAAMPSAPPAENGLRRRVEAVAGDEFAVLHAPLEIQGRPLGWLATARPAGTALDSARDTALQVGLVLLAAMVGLVLLGGLLSRVTLRQVRALVETSRAIGGGDLSARAPILADDEVGELAQAVNQMADELQQSHQVLEARVSEATAEVRRLLEERTEFFASLSHELRTPLAIILGEARMRLDPAYRRSGHGSAWRAVEGSASDLLDLVNAILELARAESGRLEITIGEVDVAALVAGLAPSFRRLTESAGITLSVDHEDGLPPALADSARLRQVILNLVDNAVKYTPAGGHVRVLTAAPGPAVIAVSVTDEGPGIPIDVGERIFEPFYRVPGSRTEHGESSTGLGLALCRRLVEAQGGTIGMAQAGTGKQGTTFTITIPAASGHAAPANGDSVSRRLPPRSHVPG